MNVNASAAGYLPKPAPTPTPALSPKQSSSQCSLLKQIEKQHTQARSVRQKYEQKPRTQQKI